MGADKEEEEKQDLQGNQKRRKGVLGQLAEEAVWVRVPSDQENLSCGALGTQIRVGAQGPKALNVWDLRPFASPSAKII